MYPPRKAYLFDSYERILASDRLLLAFQNNNMRRPQIDRIRQAVQDIKMPADWEGDRPRIRMTLIRKGIMEAVIKQRESKAVNETLVGRMSARVW